MINTGTNMSVAENYVMEYREPTDLATNREDLLPQYYNDRLLQE